MKTLFTRLMYLYDYMYYCLTKWFKRFYPEEHTPWQGDSIVSLLQFFILFDIFGTFYLVFYSASERKSSLNIVVIILIVLVVINTAYNQYKYRNKYKEYETRWANLDEKKKDRLDLIVLLLAIIPLIYLPILTNVFDFTK